MKILLLFLLFLPSTSALAALSPEAQTYLNKIPEKKLTLPFVIQAAVVNAQAYRMIGLQYASAGLEEMGTIDSVTDTLLVSSGGYADDNSVKNNPFQPVRARQWQWSLGLQKNWGTGTTTSLGWVQEDANLEFANLGAFGNAFITQFKQSAAELTLEQSLLKDSFGYAFRRKQEATQARAASIQWDTRKQLEDVTTAFIGQYYEAWLLQQNVLTIQANVERQKRLVRVLTQRAKKGAVTSSDLIQIETLLATTKTNLSAVENTLANRWDLLAISLGFPESFLQVDPMDIPTSIDNPVPLALRVCGLKEPVKTAEIKTLEKQLEGLDNDYKASENETLPDLKLVAGYRGNSLDPRAAVNFNNVVRGRAENAIGLGPAWNVGVQLAWPLSNSGARAKQATAYIEKERTTALLQNAVDSLKSDWRDLCRKLQVESKNEKVFQNIVLEQRKRVKNDGRRFRLGRISVNQLVDAETDLSDWEYRSHQKKVEVRNIAWQVQRYSGDLYRFLTPLVEPMLEKAQL
jgi:outer membrane protein TolC